MKRKPRLNPLPARVLQLFLIGLPLLACQATAIGAGLSSDTEACLGCHRMVTPGIVADWEKSRHALVSPADGLKKPALERRISAEKIGAEISGVVVGCAECHTLNGAKHPDTFMHNGFAIHSVVSSPDCAVCHPVETEQFSRNIMSRAHGNLNNNPLYHDLIRQSIGTQKYSAGKLALAEPDELTTTDSCNYCHGTVVEFKGLKERETDMGAMELPVYSGWPNQGVGRINPDGAKGNCSACHARHEFSIEVARKPHTCAECHKGPDVPAYQVYTVSKHGNIYHSKKQEWDFTAVPWTVGQDFTAPTCAECHAALVVTPEGEVLAERTHQFNDRMKWRIFGLPYAHPHPADPDTTRIKNKNGLPLPATLTGEFATEYLIDQAEQEKRRNRMKRICTGCHSAGWYNGHFTRLDNTIAVSNRQTRTATDILLAAYAQGMARGPGAGDSLFNETIEKKWVESWLFFGNSTRYASAMMGADYGVFANGRWWLNKNIAEMADYLDFLKAARQETEED